MDDDRSKLIKQAKYTALGAVRRKFSYSAITKRVYRERLSEVKGVRGGKRFVCDGCGASEGQANLNVDHIIPVVPLDKAYSDLTLDEIIENIFCEYDNLQLLCKECHTKKTTEEKDLRKANRKVKKKLGLLE